jgi:hypothetical protein
MFSILLTVEENDRKDELESVKGSSDEEGNDNDGAHGSALSPQLLEELRLAVLAANQNQGVMYDVSPEVLANIFK